MLSVRACCLLWLLIALLPAAHALAGTASITDPNAVPNADSRTDPSAKPPNIIWIISDDQSWTDYGFMGHPRIRTPRLDALADQSALFRRGYVPTSLCRPSLATLLTGHYASVHGITGNDPSPKHVPMGSPEHDKQRAELIAKIDRFTTVPEALAQAGYLTLQTGKHWEGSYQRVGFTHGMTRGFPHHPNGRHGDVGLKIGRTGLKPIESFMDEAVAKDKPFFVWYAPFLPHTPHNPPQRLLDHYAPISPMPSVAKYEAMCEWFDETCGELVDLVEARGLSENTLVIYVTDNGWIQSENDNRFTTGSKQSPREMGVRTPIFYHWPGTIKPHDRRELTSSVDIVPTTLAAAGVDPKSMGPLPLPGKNILPQLIHGGAIDQDTVFGEGLAHDIADINNPEASLLYRWVIRGDWKLLLTYDGETNRYADRHLRQERRPQLYNLIQDPHETTNLAAKHPDKVAELVQALQDWYPVKQRNVVTKWHD